METKVNMKAVTVYQASINFEGKYYTTPITATLEETMDYVMRARKATHRKNMLCNIMEVVRYVPAE
jgi:hypothetical protein